MLPAPDLDDRRFQNLVDDARRLVRERFPEWSDHNISDPGITLIEAVATMVDQLIYRLNRVPDRNYLKFLDLLGLELRPASTARTRVTFWLSAPQPQIVNVRSGTEVSTVRTDVTEPVVFSTDRALDIIPCSAKRVFAAPADADPTDRSLSLRGDGFDCFSATPRTDDALLVELTDPVPSCAVLLRITCRVAGVGVDPRRPPLRWEALTERGWVACDLGKDETGGFNEPGDVVVHLPDDHARAVVAGQRGAWLRCRLIDAIPGQQTYTLSPHITALSAQTVGGTTPAAHMQTVPGEVLGISDGSVAQRFRLHQHPVVRSDALSVTVSDGTESSTWRPVDDFADCSADDPVFHLDPVSGEVVFGPAIRDADGSVRGYGAIPRKGAVVAIGDYRIGGGADGNVGVGQLRVLKSSVPFIARVENRVAAVGGAEAETIDELKLRGPVVLRSRGRAVTAEDFEELTRQAAPEIARVHCLADDAAPGVIRLLVIPHVADSADGEIRVHDLTPQRRTLDTIAGYLDERRLVGTRLLIEPPQYIGVTVLISLSAVVGFDRETVKADVRSRVYRLLHPVRGGRSGRGWPVARSLGVPDLAAAIADVPGVDMSGEVDVQLMPVNPATERRGEPTDRLTLPPNGLFLSHRHQVRVI
ncbi:putative baseplate assembly protein [Gordonia sp. LSe1-13]|uniref:Baseplate assembly protein n=1 Tax=Gordonia sesuvii TaxID=3116777 RepID=A0ABU7MCS2_9ACTN|nr:putative baseplate assembly protein [Gordonia sp. LSe1-13]